jgi:hypothetical protein
VLYSSMSCGKKHTGALAPECHMHWLHVAQTVFEQCPLLPHTACLKSVFLSLSLLHESGCSHGLPLKEPNVAHAVVT